MQLRTVCIDDHPVAVIPTDTAFPTIPFHENLPSRLAAKWNAKEKWDKASYTDKEENYKLGSMMQYSKWLCGELMISDYSDLLRGSPEVDSRPATHGEIIVWNAKHIDAVNRGVEVTESPQTYCVFLIRPTK